VVARASRKGASLDDPKGLFNPGLDAKAREPSTSVMGTTSRPAPNNLCKRDAGQR